LVNLLDDSKQRNYSPEHLDVFDSELWLLRQAINVSCQ
jgi:hypothetical protein